LAFCNQLNLKHAFNDPIMSARFENKVMSPAACLQQLATKSWSGPIVFTNGVFDILHRGHVTYLDEAAQLGGSLIVAVNSDASAKRLGKGPDRPLNNAQDRAALLAALACVTAVTFFDEDTPVELIGQLRPDIIVKGGDYDMQTLPESKLVESWGGKAVAIPFEFARSTTALVQKIRAS
jgi:rfaE bifunctional protein nucleotidyltransferase chain/domain